MRRVFGLLPAAGLSTRMGRPKLALPLGGRTVLERVIGALRAGGVEDILLMLGPHVADLRPIAENAGAHVLLLEQQTPDMRATIEVGLDWLERNVRPTDGDAFLLLPPDHPTLSKDVIELLLHRAEEKPAKSIVIPAFEGKRGHPALIGWKHVPGIRALPKDQGLNIYLRSRAGETEEVACPFRDVLCDLDTPEDYARLAQRFSVTPTEP